MQNAKDLQQTHFQVKHYSFYTCTHAILFEKKTNKKRDQKIFSNSEQNRKKKIAQLIYSFPEYIITLASIIRALYYFFTITTITPHLTLNT